MKNLSDKQIKILQYIKDCGGVSPSVREICIATNISSTSSVHANLKKLEEMGYISMGKGITRSIMLAGVKASYQVPILGTVTAGEPILAFEDVLGYIPYENKNAEELFALKVKGFSMKDIGIMDGDFVIARKTSTAQNGDIVVALIEDSATVKTFYKENEGFRLQAENDDFEPIIVKELTILGKVVSQIRYY